MCAALDGRLPSATRADSGAFAQHELRAVHDRGHRGLLAEDRGDGPGGDLGHRLPEAAGAAVLGVFVAAMTVGRTVGTRLLDRWGRVRVLLATMLLAIAGTIIVGSAGSLPAALVGVALWGLGTSLGFPVGMSAAADDADEAAARVSVVAVIGYTAFLAGPPLVGLLGDQVGTLRALLVVPVLLVPALALLPATRPPRRR